MASDLTVSRKIPAQVSIDEVRAALLRTSSRIGKAYIDKKGNVVLRPRSSMHRITISSELDAGREDTSVLTFSGRKGISFGRFLLMMVFVVMMLITVIGIVIVFITNRSSNKTLERGFADATTSALEMVS